METTITEGLLIILFVITWIVIACNGPESQDDFKPLSITPPYDWYRELLERDNKSLKYELEYWKARSHPHPRCLEMNQPCCPCEVRKEIVYAKTPDEQALVDLMKEMGKPYEKIKKELGIK